VLDRTGGTETEIHGHALILRQLEAEVFLDEQGSIRVTQPATPPRDRGTLSLPVVIEEDVVERIQRALNYERWVLDRVDAMHRMSDVVPIVALFGAGSHGWRTRAEHNRNPQTMELGVGRPDPIVVTLSPARRHRSALRVDAVRIAEDVTVLLRRQMRQ
jgi:hypothetical protein